MKQIKTIDISAWQGKISVASFKKIKEQTPYVILRCSYTTMKKFSLHEDSVFAQNIKNAYKVGLKIGIYHYAQAISEAEAKKEAEYVLHVLAAVRSYITLNVFFDWEFGGRLSAYVAKKMGKQRCGQICDAFSRTIKMAGYKTGVYANLSTLTGYLPSDLYKKWPIWVAQYNSKCNYKHEHIAWQYTSGGKVSGIPGRVDMNWWYGTEPAPVPVDTYHGALPTLPARGWFTSGDGGKGSSVSKEEVKKLQRFLNWYGGYGLDVDGEVGRKTINAVKQYQGREKLKIDGAFGSECLKRAKTVRR